MNRKLLVTLLHKNIEELGMITESFRETYDTPQAIIILAKRKSEDIQTILDELAASNLQSEIKPSTPEPTVIQQIEPEELPIQEITLDEIESSKEQEMVISQTIEIEEINDIVETTQTTETVITEVKKQTEEHKTVTIADKMANQTTSRNEMHSHAYNSLSATMANKKVTDIKQAISIGDRFRFQRELFKSNGEDMNKTLTYLNQLATLEEALTFLNSKYNWEKSEATEDFYQIVKRKFTI